MRTIKPPQQITENRNKMAKHSTKVFLAGTIEMGDSIDWQGQLSELLKHGQFLVLNPRRDDWDSSWETSFTDPQFFQQVTWELNAMDKADIIIMNLLPDSKSPISLLELGLYASSGKLVVCCPDGFWRKGNVDIVCEKYNIPVYREFKKLVNDYLDITI